MIITRFIVLPWLVCLAAVVAYAQSPCPEKILTTSTTASINIEKPSMKNFDPTREHPMIFDWTQKDFLLSSYKPGLRSLVSITSPFFQEHGNTVPLAVIRDMHSDDGWELILQDFGYVYQWYLPVDLHGLKRTDHTGGPAPTGNPYFLLYNRYTGVVRIFVAVGVKEAYNTAQITMYQRTYGTLIGPLVYSTDAPLLPLDRFAVNVPTAVMPFINASGSWLYADIPVLYDPCTCLYQSSLQVDVHLYSIATVNTGDSTYQVVLKQAYVHGLNFFTPGAKDNATRQPQSGYPMYNQVLGTCNVLTTPKVKSYYHVDSVRYIPRGGEFPVLVCEGKNAATRFYQLAEDVEFIINPAAGFDMDSIDVLAALEFEFDYDIDRELKPYDRSMLVAEGHNRYRTRFVPLGCLRDVIIPFRYNEFSCPPDAIARIGDPPVVVPAPISRAPQISLLIMARLPRAEHKTKTETFVGKYPVALVDVPTYDPAQWVSSGIYDAIKEELILAKEHVAGRHDAWTSITVASGTDVGAFASGTTGVRRATLTAGEIITVKPGGRIHGESTLRIGTPRVRSCDLPVVSPSRLITFCTSSPYTSPRDFRKESATATSREVVQVQDVVGSLRGIAPNPSEDRITIHYQMAAPSIVSIEVVNPLGVTVGTVVPAAEHTAGEHTAGFDGSGLARGVYYCVLRCNGDVQMRQFILY